MNTDTKAFFRLSAYRLKTFDQAVSSSKETNQSPYLKAVLSGKVTTPSRIRVSPMMNPYAKNHTVATDAQKEKSL